MPLLFCYANYSANWYSSNFSALLSTALMCIFVVLTANHKMNDLYFMLNKQTLSIANGIAKDCEVDQYQSRDSTCITVPALSIVYCPLGSKVFVLQAPVGTRFVHL